VDNMGAKRRTRLTHLATVAPELVDAIEKATARRQHATKQVGGVKVQPPTPDAQRTLQEDGRALNIAPGQCLSAASWYLAEAVCLGFAHTRRANPRDAGYRVPCDRCLEAGTRAVHAMYTKGVQQ
jgi:hypothetical protein